MSDVAKRPAFESPADLVQPVRPNPRMRRPAATAVGALLVLLRVLAGAVWLVVVAGSWRQVAEEELDGTGLDPDDLGDASNAVLGIILIAGGVILAFEIVLAVLIYFGVNWSRVLVMVFATFSISVTFVAWWVGDQQITVDETLLTLALDILVMLALSSRAARAYARRDEGDRRSDGSEPVAR